jgi:hypothetical protein
MMKGHPVVSYLHRTVRDFLRTANIMKLLEDRAGIQFDTDAILLEASSLSLRNIRHLADEPFTLVPPLVNTVLYHASTLEKKRRIVSWEQINAAEKMLNEREIPSISTHTLRAGGAKNSQSWFMAHVVMHELHRYLDLRFVERPRLVTSGEIDYLRYDARGFMNEEPVHEPSDDAVWCPSVIELLVKAGFCNSDSTPPDSSRLNDLWPQFLSNLTELRPFLTPKLEGHFIVIVERMITAGAVAATVPVDAGGQVQMLEEDEALRSLFGDDETKRLLALRVSHGKTNNHSGWIGWLWK